MVKSQEFAIGSGRERGRVSIGKHIQSILHNRHQFPGGIQNLIPPRRKVEEGNGNPLQYSCLENPMGRGAWWAAVHGVVKSWT